MCLNIKVIQNNARYPNVHVHGLAEEKLCFPPPPQIHGK